MSTKKRLTADEFDALRPHLQRFDKQNIVAIRRVLVCGDKQKDVAAELNLSKEAMSAMVVRAWKIHLEHGDRPEGWVKVEAVLPPHIAEVVQEMANIARTKARK
jgi:hypothetical protein